MNPFKTPTSSGEADWLFFGVILMTVGLGIAIFSIRFYLAKKTGKKPTRKRRHRHHRTLAKNGGLPPRRDFNQPPHGT